MNSSQFTRAALNSRENALGHRGEIPLLALAARHQPRLELVGLSGDAFGINPLHR